MKLVKENKNKNILYGGLIFILGILTTFGLIYHYPNIINTNTIKLEKEVTITDTGISEAVSKVYDSVVIISTYINGSIYASGSGFIYKVDNDTTYIITNHHVISEGNSYKVTYTDGQNIDATLLGSDEYSDIAILKVATRSEYKAVTIGDTSLLKTGDTSFTVGAPLDNIYSWTVTRGIISGKERLVEVSTSNSNSTDYVINVLQTDAAVNSGNSGGPLCNSNGEVIGVISAKLSGTGIEGMGFAIPIETAVEKAEQILNNENSDYPYLGISMLNVSDIKSYPRYYNYITSDLDSGIVIVDIEKDSLAIKSGLETGDIITKIDDIEVTNMAYLRYALYKHKVGETINITYYRDNKQNTIQVKLS